MAPVTFDSPQQSQGAHLNRETDGSSTGNGHVNGNGFSRTNGRLPNDSYPGAATMHNSSSVPLWLDGVQINTHTTFDVKNPGSGKVSWTSSTASPKNAIHAVEAARNAFPTWRTTTPAAMQTIFLKAAEITDRRRAELAEYLKIETASPDPFIEINIMAMINMFRDVAGRPGNIHGVVPQSSIPGKSGFVLKEPFGVNLGIAPWNAPYILGTRAALFPLAAGNTVVLKGSERSPRCFWAIGSVLHEAGLPVGALNIIYAREEDAVSVTEALIEHDAVRKINFTGSTAIGAVIAAKAGKALKPVVMELGGKASAIVCADADIAHAAQQCVLGAFAHAGQICMSTERILVHRDILQPFSAALKSICEQIFPPAPAPASTLIDSSAVRKNQSLVRNALYHGASLLHGPTPPPHQSANETCHMHPTIVAGVTPAMEIYHIESFGPTVSLIPVDSDEDAVRIANNTPYGLSSAIFSRDLRRALRLARQIDAGAVHINNMTVHDEPGLPHGGVKSSGWGRFNAQWGVEEFLKLKTITFDDE